MARRKRQACDGLTLVALRRLTVVPPQWRGELMSGEIVFIRYERGILRVGLGETYKAAGESALANPYFIEGVCHTRMTHMTDSDMVNVTQFKVEEGLRQRLAREAPKNNEPTRTE